MGFSTVRPYVAQVMADLGFSYEWEDAFNDENIPDTKLDEAWALRFGTANYQGTAHESLQFIYPVTILVFKKGYRNPQEAVDSLHLIAEAITKKALEAPRRLNQASIKNVLPSTVDISPLNASNDNAAKLTMNFNFIIYLKP